jgi:chromate transporter
VHPIFVALEAMVIGILIHIFFDFSSRHLKSWRGAVLAGTAFILLMFKVNAIAIILIALVVAEILMKDLPHRGKHNLSTSRKISRIDRIGFLLTGALYFAILIWGILAPKGTMGQLLFSMFKVGAVAFGNAFTIMPLLHQEAVVSHHWLNMKQFADGIALGQITPGPFLITATFIGFKVKGIWGSILATFGIFFPSFFYTILATETYHRIRDSLWVQRAIAGILAAFTGMLGYIALTLGAVVLKRPLPWIWTIGSLIAVRYFKLNLVWIFLTGIVIAVLFHFSGIPIF